MFEFLSRSCASIRLAIHKLSTLFPSRRSDNPLKIVRKKQKKTHCKKHSMPKNYTEFEFTLRPVKKDHVVKPKKSVLFSDKVELFEFSKDRRVLSAVIPFELQIDEYMNMRKGVADMQQRVSIDSTSSSESETDIDTANHLYEELLALRMELLQYYYQPGDSHISQQLPISISA
ncbi:hypothetical protein IWW36_001718 [Coemansia brasiliensis]|uniref:Uncharacterized protein n=1 Tax=Coemansia brasiliensis TaxID=2650707 RepID=A0A9W8M1R9_9FUNG|nr:hypothetical protein IWW36_001718 [Coemansia brasiliensis]